MNNDRIIRGYDVGPFDFQRFSTMGITPYVYLSNNLEPSTLIEVNRNNYLKYVKTMLFLLTPDEYMKTITYINTTNKLIELYNKKIKLIKEMVPGVMMELIKDGSNKKE